MQSTQTERAMARTDHGTQKRYVCKTVDSPIGRLKLVATDEGLAGILWEKDRPGRVRLDIEAEDNRHPVLTETERQLEEYFAGERKAFAVRLDLVGTAFQRKVWSALLTIPFGETRSYGQIARQIGNPDAVRAVGAANGRNPVSIIAPCHRVVGCTGKLTGFAGGLDAKAHLLALEGAKTAAIGSGPVRAMVPATGSGYSGVGHRSLYGRDRRPRLPAPRRSEAPGNREHPDA
jgi:methylated-DNA-[protein]-cysteine S-methyltransferase